MRASRTVILAVGLLAVGVDGRAQDPPAPVSRADVSATIGWLNAKQSEVDTYRGGNDWYNRSVYGGVGLGWYWTDHWRTDIESGVSSSADLWAYTTRVIDGRGVSVSTNYTFSTKRLAIGQQYQFYRNTWVHPFLGAGLDLTWERTSRNDEVVWPLPSRTATHPTRTELLVRPFAIVGLKTYLSQRAFVRTDLRCAFDRGIDEALLRFGFGVDF
jgi:outer membrane protein W